MKQVLKLVGVQLRLLIREPQVLSFVFAFPVVTVLVLGGVFDEGDTAFEGVVPSDYYVAAYIGVVIAAIGLIMLPVQLASYREAGVLRRFEAAGFSRWAFPASQFIVGLMYVAAGTVTVIAAAAASYGVPAMEAPGRTIVGIVVGALSFISIGVLIGTVMPNPRAAQGVGLVLFFPMFLLAGGGPPPDAMPSVMKNIGNLLPLTHVMRAVQEPWLAIGSNTNHLVVAAAIFVASTAGWMWVSTNRAIA